MDSVADLNARAEAVAAIYDEVVLLTSEGMDLTNVATGGDPQAVTYGAGGVAGPTSDEPGIDGICWSGVNSFDLGEPATHFGLLVGGVVYRTFRIADHSSDAGTVGPGVVPFVHGVGPGGRPADS